MTADEFYQDVRGALCQLYPTAYLTSWSGAEFHDLTASSSTDYVLFSNDVAQDTSVHHYRQLVIIKKIPFRVQEGLIRVSSPNGGFVVADVHRTLVDMLYDPVLAGGDEILTEAWEAYFNRPDCDFNRLIAYAEKSKMTSVLTWLNGQRGMK